MTKERELLRRALEVLDEKVIGYEITKGAIRAYLSTPSDDAEEPVKWNDITDKELIELHGEDQFGLFCDADEFIDISRSVIEKFKYQNAHPPKPAEQEADKPAAWMHSNGGVIQTRLTGLERDTYTIPLYTRPEPARKPMTEEEIKGKGKFSDRALPWITAGIRFAEKHHGITE